MHLIIILIEIIQ